VGQFDAHQDRAGLKATFSALKSVTVADAVPIPLASVGAMKDLVQAVRRAEDRISGLVAKGCCSCSVLVARFFFERSGAHAALAPAIALGVARGERAAAGSFPIKLPALSNVQCAQLEMKLMWQGDDVSLGVWSRVAGASVTYVVELQAVSPALLLLMRGVHVRTGGRRAKGSGLCSIKGSRAAAVDALVDGLLCVISIHACEVDAGPEYSPMSLDVQALHLDEFRGVGHGSPQAQ